ncbi:hypothetical protein PQX77_014124 [Marasmius sp. AFHP31]|nr:hypothetical protein PQX77_014124 [Marasmius sp. AFHP31]
MTFVAADTVAEPVVWQGLVDAGNKEKRVHSASKLSYEEPSTNPENRIVVFPATSVFLDFSAAGSPTKLVVEGGVRDEPQLTGLKRRGDCVGVRQVFWKAEGKSYDFQDGLLVSNSMVLRISLVHSQYHRSVIRANGQRGTSMASGE